MLVAALVLVLGFLSVAYVTQSRGLRLGGTIVVPVLALYTLKNFIALPVFLVSTALAWAALWAAKQYTLVYGRDELVVSIVAGSVLPLGLLFLGDLVGLSAVLNLRGAVFLGSILPGLAAFNSQQMKPGYRRQDALFGFAIYLGLLFVGAVLISPRLAPTLAPHTPLVLFAETSDIAVFRGAIVEGELFPILISRPLAVGVLVGAFLLSELARDRFGVRAGVITLGLLAIYAPASRWLLVLFLLVTVVVATVIATLHRTTLLYGRVLIGLGAAMAVAVTVPLTLALPVVRGLSAVFVAILAGVTAYNRHVTPPRERRMQLPVSLAVFAPLFLVSRVLSDASPRGLLADVSTLPWLAIGVVVVTVGAYLLLRVYRIEQPSDEAVLSASVLSGGEG